MVNQWGIQKFRTALLFITMLVVLAGCSSGNASNESDSASASGQDKVKKIIVGTGTQFPNVCFIDENGKLTGYDVELIREIDKRLPEYEFEFSTMEFKNLLLSLETKKIDLIAHQMEVNEERQAKFLFNDEAYNIFPNKIVVSEKNQDVKSIEDLKGKKLIVGATSNAAVLAEKWNAANGNAIDIVYSGAGEDTNTQIKTGRVDATISTQFAIDYQNKVVDAQLKTVGEALSNSKVYFILNKDEEELKTKIDEALKSIKEDGTLSKLSTEWLGADYTVEE
ncbi:MULTISPECIES: transporter substrate-binding domain-containing protein [Paenibacillus]|uniref:transporter substrate-binding domain-containing protein n=1 Tax=Paenibacillus TaxID=44249 RepID=UPI0007BF8C46|nr:MULTISPECIES: transporter substrate-binding domain-containing protein [Paenibacillus]MCZ1264397.1 amino acid ABC transporter substrate-binding protein [Paenibacillus tundrae]OAX46708.1 L-cystine-binding protein TcyK [Paenibacillus sp. AD87]WDQ32700.1 transporter substrate-binding domain-containing protein [Paenibacillus marchantiae]SDL99174.1 L-cystine transport system substrate-binding protein [Paenibacillus sp. OK060]SEB26901.1 L-cystine transport system substrate-binding protein [Paeniba